MTIRQMPLVMLLVLLTGHAQAMTWGELSREIESVEGGAAGNREIILRFSEMVHMLASYTRLLREQDLPALICPAQGQSVNIDELVSLVREEARRIDADNDALVQDLLLAGFQKKFPCVE